VLAEGATWSKTACCGAAIEPRRKLGHACTMRGTTDASCLSDWPMSHKRPAVLLVILLSLGSPSLPLAAQDVALDTYPQVGATYVINLLRLSVWPEAAFADHQSPLVITLVGESRILPILQETFGHERIHGRQVIMQVLEYPRSGPDMATFERSLRNTHLVYIPRGEEAHVDAIIESTRGLPVLTVSSIARFVEDHGGMIGLMLQQGRINIAAHPERIAESTVIVSARLLRLASLMDAE